jgi:hypothetical protein
MIHFIGRLLKGPTIWRAAVIGAASSGNAIARGGIVEFLGNIPQMVVPPGCTREPVRGRLLGDPRNRRLPENLAPLADELIE